MPFDLVLACVVGFTAAACAMAITLAAIKQRSGWGGFLAAYLGPLLAAAYLVDRLAAGVGDADPPIIGRWLEVVSSVMIFFSRAQAAPGRAMLASLGILLAVFAVVGSLVGVFERRAPRPSRAPPDAGSS